MQKAVKHDFYILHISSALFFLSFFWMEMKSTWEISLGFVGWEFYCLWVMGYVCRDKSRSRDGVE